MCGKTPRGIYRIRDDTLEICVNGAETAQRPTRFTTLASEDGGGAVLFTYQRTAEAWTDLLRLPNARSGGIYTVAATDRSWPAKRRMTLVGCIEWPRISSGHGSGTPVNSASLASSRSWKAGSAASAAGRCTLR